MTDLQAGKHVRRLLEAGVKPSPALTRQVLGGGAAVVTPLITLACEMDLLYDDAPACYAPIHALRLLGELCPAEAISPLVRAAAYPFEPTNERDPADVWLSDVAMILGRFGAPAIAALQELLDNPELPETARAIAIDALAFTAATSPDARPALIADLRTRLAATEDPVRSAEIALALGALTAGEAYQEIMSRYSTKTIDVERAPAPSVRQMLLAKTNPRFGCVRHTLDERYAQHGPWAAAAGAA